ncbi:SH3 domain-containing protein [Anaeromassilibacillus sp. An250]|uniref:SH3 domain-containing protein n=1 Tax=Anaeromassilibacillus sp. An250 TaxID=1965604 RepID=UPI00111F16C0|nr:SH3 domain-containing protein [Anaeromassilibacillus sp. An250]
MRKHFRRMGSAAAALLCTVSLAVTALPTGAWAASTAQTTDYLNLRTGAGQSYSVLLTMPKGTEVTILDDSQGEWAKVRLASGQEGYCSKEYLTAVGSLSTATYGALATGDTAVTTANLNVRKGVGTSYGIVTTLAEGASVTILDSSHATWAKVRTASGLEGYCLKEYLSGSAATGGSSSSTGSGTSTGMTAVTQDYLNLRTGPGTNYDRVLTLAQGVSVSVLDNSNAEWVKVRTTSGQEGYCSRQYLTISGSSSGGNTGSSSSGTSGEIIATVKENLNLREGAGPSYAIIKTMQQGDTVTVIDNSHPTWARVRTADGTVGCCSKEFLDIQANSASGTPSDPSDAAGGSSTANESLPATAKESVAMRTGAGTSYEVIRALFPQENVTVTDNSHATWAKIRTSDGTEGYCMKQYLDIQTASTGTDPGTGNTGDGQTITGATVTADALRLRSGPGTQYDQVATLLKGATLTVLDTSNAGWTKVQTANNLTGYVSNEYIQFLYNGQTGVSADALTISRTSGTVSAGKTLYIKATANPSTASVTWSSSNTAVATVTNGYIYGVSPGTAVITATSGSQPKTCTVTVTAAEPVRTAYASPNIAGVGSAVTFTAITDTTRDGVRFTVQFPSGTTQMISATSSTTETTGQTSTKVWKAAMNLTEQGTYRVTVSSSQGGVYSAESFETSAYVVSSQDYTVTTSEQRRASDKMIELIANWEGYSASVYADKLTSTQVPTLGYGLTLKEGDTFYNDLSKTEAWSLLVNTVNSASYTTEVNKFITQNNLLMSQCQFDSLVSFGYNVGAGYWNSTSSEIDLRRIILNAVVPPQDFGTGMSATISKATVVRSTPSLSGTQVCEAEKGTAITVTSANFSNQKDGWYLATLPNGSTGWINSGYVTLNGANLVHDLNYTNAYAFGTDMLRWNQAGGKSYAGLLYRRLGEANVYNYNDYSASRVNTYGYTYPAALAYLDTQ